LFNCNSALAGRRPDQRLFSGRLAGSVTAAPAASETGQGFDHTVTLQVYRRDFARSSAIDSASPQRSGRRPRLSADSFYRQESDTGDAPTVLRANQRRGADARSCPACHRGNFPFRPPRRDAKRLALHRRLAPTHDVILASQKGEVNLASQKGEVNLASQKGEVNLASQAT
jgi:hypothetical protein